MAKERKPPRRGGSVTLPRGATKDDIDNALRGPAKQDAPKGKEKT